jgi:hypothetical protein
MAGRYQCRLNRRNAIGTVPAMNTLKLNFHTWLMVVGALGMVVFGLFVDWSTFEAFGVSVSSGNAFDWTRGTLSFLLVVAVAGVAVLRDLGTLKDDGIPWNLAMLGGSGAAALMMGLLLLTGPDEAGVDLGRGAGLWLSAVSTLFSLAGALSAFVAGGGKVSDFTDTTKLTGAFRRRTAK